MRMRAALLALLSILACGTLPAPPPAASELIGTRVIISFNWENPTSVLSAMSLAGTLISVDHESVLVRIDDEMTSEPQRRVVKGLEKWGKIELEEEGTLARVARKEIADLRPYPPTP